MLKLAAGTVRWHLHQARAALRAVLVPTAEDDAAVHLPILEDFFQRPAGYLFLTPEEQGLVATRAGRMLRPSATVGMGLEPANLMPSRGPLDDMGIPNDYVLYLGRVDRPARGSLLGRERKLT